MNQYSEVVNKIKSLQAFDIKGIKGKVLYADSLNIDGKSINQEIHGSITFNNNINNIPFAFDGDYIDGNFSYRYDEIKYSPVTLQWIKENLENQMLQLIYFIKAKEKIALI